MQAEELKEIFAERGIKRVKLGGFDIDGVLRGKYISLEKFWGVVEKGFGFCDVIFGWDVSDQLYASRPPRICCATSGSSPVSRTRRARATCSRP
jgi:hypothetical protein